MALTWSDRVKAWALRLLRAPVHATLGQVFAVLGAGVFLGVGLHDVALQDAGVLPHSWSGPVVMWILATACAIVAARPSRHLVKLEATP